MSVKTFMYFAFGSNLLRERILISNPTAKFVSIGTLYGFKLGFDYPQGVPEGDDRWFGAVATIRPADPESYVMGCIWEIDLDQVAKLDKQETYYFPMEVEVQSQNDEKMVCRTYQMINEVTGYKLPGKYYIKVMVDGAKQGGFPEEYIKFLENQPVNERTEPPPIYYTVMKNIEEFREAEKKN